MDNLVDTFIGLTQWQGSRDEAKAYLEASNSNLNTAVALYLDFSDNPNGNTSPFAPQSPSQTAQRRKVPEQSLMEELSAEYSADLVKTVAPRVSSAHNVVNLRYPRPVAVVFSLLDNLLGFISFLIPTAIIRYLTSSNDNGRSTTIDKILTSVLKEEPHLAESISSRILRGVTYNAALEHVKSKFGYLVVVVVSEVHEVPSSQFIANVLNTATAQRNNVYYWIGSALTVEGLRVAEAFKSSSLPLVSVVSPSPKSAQSNVIVMANLLTFYGDEMFATPQARKQFDALVESAIEDHEPRLMSLRLERERFDVDRKIREEQDNAYQTSLKRDQQRAEEAKALEKRALMQEFRHKVWLSEVFARASRALSVGQGVPCARVSLRLPDGKRHNLSVPGDAPVRTVYDLTYSILYPEKKDEISNFNGGDTIGVDFEGFEPPYGFDLVSTVQRRPLPVDDTVVKDVDAIWPSGVLMVDLELD